MQTLGFDFIVRRSNSDLNGPRWEGTIVVESVR